MKEVWTKYYENLKKENPFPAEPLEILKQMSNIHGSQSRDWEALFTSSRVMIWCGQQNISQLCNICISLKRENNSWSKQ